MSDLSDEPKAIVRPEDVLADGQERAEFDGVSIRKGTVAAFIQNAQRWLDHATSDADRAALSDELRSLMPSLQALGVLTVFEIRDEHLRNLLA